MPDALLITFKKWLEHMYVHSGQINAELALSEFDKSLYGTINQIRKLECPPYDLQNDRNDSRMRGYNEALRDIMSLLGAKFE